MRRWLCRQLTEFVKEVTRSRVEMLESNWGEVERILELIEIGLRNGDTISGSGEEKYG